MKNIPKDAGDALRKATRLDIIYSPDPPVSIRAVDDLKAGRSGAVSVSAASVSAPAFAASTGEPTAAAADLPEAEAATKEGLEGSGDGHEANAVCPPPVTRRVVDTTASAPAAGDIMSGESAEVAPKLMPTAELPSQHEATAAFLLDSNVRVAAEERQGRDARVRKLIVNVRSCLGPGSYC